MQVACLKKAASLLFCVVVAVVIGSCLMCPVVVVDATAVAWYVDGATLVDWGSGSLVVSNATDFQLLNSNISETKLELQLTSMAELALRPPLSADTVVSLTIRNTTFFEDSQLWMVGGSSHGGVRFDVLVEGCTFSESLFALTDLWIAHGSRFRFSKNKMTRTTLMNGATNLLHQTHAAWQQNSYWQTTASILCLLHNVTVADHSDFLMQESSFDVNVPVGRCAGIMSTGGVVVEGTSTWKATGLKILAEVPLSGTSHAYGMMWWESTTVTNSSSTYSISGCNVTAYNGGSVPYAYGMLWYTSSSTITTNNSTYSISDCNVSGYSSGGSPSHGLHWLDYSSTITSDHSIYSIRGCDVTAQSGSSYAYGFYWKTSSSTTTSNHSSYIISGCNVSGYSESSYAYGMLWVESSTNTSNYATYDISGSSVSATSGSSSFAYGMHWRETSNTVVSYYSTYCISDCTLSGYSEKNSFAYGLFWYYSSSTTTSHYSAYMITGCNVSGYSGSAKAYGLYWYSSSRTTTFNYASYFISGCTVTVYSGGSYAYGMLWHTHSSTLTSDYSTYAISGCNLSAHSESAAYGLLWHTASSTITANYSTYSVSGCTATASSRSSVAYGMFWYLSSDTILSSGSVFRLDRLVFAGGINQGAILRMFSKPSDDPLGFYLSSNNVLVDQDIGVPLSGAYTHTRCNRKLGALLPGQTEPCNDTSCGSLPMHCHPQFTESRSFSNGSCVCSCKNATQLLAITAPPIIENDESAEWLASLLDPSCYPLIATLLGRHSALDSVFSTPSRTNSGTRTSSRTRTNYVTPTLNVGSGASATLLPRLTAPSSTVVQRPSVSAVLPQSRTSHRSTTAKHDTLSVSPTLYRGGKLDDRDSTHTPVEDTTQPPVVSDTVSTVAEVLGSETAAEAVVGTGAASVAVAGLVTSPAGASQAVRLGAIAGAIECSYSDDDVVPSLFEHPFQISLGDGPLKVYVGSTLLSTLLFIAMPWLVIAAVCVYGLKAAGVDLNPTLQKVQSKVFSNFALVSLAYMGPVMCKSFVLVVAHDPTATDVAVVSVCVLVALCAVAVVAWAVFRGGKKGSTGREEDDDAGADDAEVELSRSEQVFEATFGLLFDGCRNLSAPVRASYLVEVGCTSLLMILDGIRPGEKNCGKVAAAMASVSLILLLYFCIARPFRARLELFFAIATSTLLFALGALAYLSNLLRDEVTLQPPEWALTAFGYVAVAESIAFFLQAAVLAGWAYTRAQRREVLRRQAEVERARGGGGGDPLLGDVPMADLQTTHVKVPADPATAAGPIDSTSHVTTGNDDAQQSMLLNPLLQPQSHGI